MHSRRDFLKGLALGAAGAAGASVLPTSSALAGTLAPDLTAPGSADCSQPAPTSSPRAGWCVYDFAFTSAEHVAALKACRPTIVRWFVSWDRHHVHPQGGGTGAVAPLPTWDAYRAVFDECRPSAANPRGTLVVVQLQCKDPCWNGDGYPTQIPGTRWARNDGWYGRQFPERYGVRDSYGPFARGLATALGNSGVEVVFGAWNEVDLRTSIKTPGRSSENFLDPWSVNPFNLINGVPYFHWSGGSGEQYQELYRSIPGAKWTTSGITHTNWTSRTASFAEVSHVDLHVYGTPGSPADYVKHVESMVAKWDAAAPGMPKRKVLIGESATNSGPATHNLVEAVWLYRRHEAMSQANENPASPLFGRYVGFASHSGGGGTTSPWQLPASNPAAAWWQYKAEYAAVP